jgi:hypothetical protein
VECNGHRNRLSPDMPQKLVKVKKFRLYFVYSCVVTVWTSGPGDFSATTTRLTVASRIRLHSVVVGRRDKCVLFSCALARLSDDNCKLTAPPFIKSDAADVWTAVVAGRSCASRSSQCRTTDWISGSPSVVFPFTDRSATCW